MIKLLQFHRNLKSKNELQKLQARISILRMNLKGKIKKRANSFRNYFSKSVIERENLEKDLNAILEIKFETGADFQKYFELVSGLHSFMMALPPLSDNPINVYLESDEQAELVIAKVVKELNYVSTIYNHKVDAFNNLNPKVKLTNVDPIQFEFMIEIERLLNLESERDKASVVEADNFKAA